MSDPAPATRGLFTGVVRIVRFNPGYFVLALAALAVVGAVLVRWGERIPAPWGGLAWVAWALAAWWIGASLLASWWIYDLSPLHRWDWVAEWLDPLPRRLVVAHAGFDEVGDSLRRRFPDREIVTVDFHDPVRMTEASIRRARRICPPGEGTIPVTLEDWPIGEPAGAVIFPLSAHEWRTPGERTRLLSRASGALAGGGRILLLEHLRDARNFVAFGPGFLHFHSRKTWRRDWRGAGLNCVGTFRVAGFLGGFVLEPDPDKRLIDD